MKKLIFLFFCAFAAMAQEENGTKTIPKLPSPKGAAGKVLGSDGTKLIWKSASDGVHPAASVTNNAAPFSFNATTQALNIPKQNKLEDNGNGTMKFTRGDGSGFDTIRVYLIHEPLFVAKYKAATETLLNNTQTIGYTQGGIAKTLETKANIILIDDTAPATQTINIPNPALAANQDFEFQIMWGKTPNQVTFNYPIYDRILGILYSSTTFVPDTRDFMTLPKLYTTDILFKSFAYQAYHIVNTNGKYFIVNR